jgi:hypothetical protein
MRLMGIIMYWPLFCTISRCNTMYVRNCDFMKIMQNQLCRETYYALQFEKMFYL